MPANLKNSAVATGLEKVSFHFNPKERLKLNVMPLPVKPVIWGHYVKKSTRYPFWLRMMDVFIKAYV